MSLVFGEILEPIMEKCAKKNPFNFLVNKKRDYKMFVAYCWTRKSTFS